MRTRVSHYTPFHPWRERTMLQLKQGSQKNTRQYPVETGVPTPPHAPMANHRTMSQTTPIVSNNA
jgi:hypothetical protein